MTDSLCVALALPSPLADLAADPAADPAAVPIDAHLDLARRTAGDDLVVSAALRQPAGGQPGAIVAARERRALERVGVASPLGDRYRHIVAGVDPATFGDASASASANANTRAVDGSEVYLHVAIDTTDPPVPFDDPAVVEIFRSQLAWYLPMLGTRYVGCAALFADGVRARGSIAAFRAESLDVARWLALADPWRRVATTWLFTIDAGVVAAALPPPGPGTQRTATFACAPRSAPEPSLASS